MLPLAKKTIFLLILLGSTLITTAQKGWEVGAWAGSSHYFGDLNTSFDLSRPHIAGGLITRYNFNERLSLRWGLNYGRISADDQDSDNEFEQQRNLNFYSDIYEGLMQLEFNFMPYTHGSSDEFFTPYAFAGFSIYHFNPKTTYNGDVVELREYGTEGQFLGDEYYSIQPSMVYGLGVKFDITTEWSINIMASSRYLFTDYIDDVSTVYPDYDDLEGLRGQASVDLADPSMVSNGEGGFYQIGETGRQRGDDKERDIYGFFGIGLVYYFGGVDCPSFYR